MNWLGAYTVRALLAAVLAVAVHAPSLAFDFSYLDDHQLIVEQQSFLLDGDVRAAFGRTFFGDASSSYYRPIVTLSLMADAHFGGTSPFGYHLSNVLLHALACVLLLRLLERLEVGGAPALMAALWFAVHPVHAASVAWIPGRSDVLLSIAVLGSSLCLLRDRAAPHWAALGGHLLSFLAALFCKETALGMPLVFWALAGWAPAAATAEGWSVRRRLYLAGWCAALGVYWLARSAAVTAGLRLEAMVPAAPQLLPLLLADFGKLVLPLRLQVLAAPEDVVWWPGVVALGIALAAVVALRGRGMRGLRGGVVGMGMLLAGVPVVMGVLASRLVVLENRLYLPAAGMAVLLAELFRVLALCVVKRRRVGLFVVGGAVPLLLLFALSTLKYSQWFRDRQSFSLAAIEGSPRSGLAGYLRQRAFGGR